MNPYNPMTYRCWIVKFDAHTGFVLSRIQSEQVCGDSTRRIMANVDQLGGGFIEDDGSVSFAIFAAATGDVQEHGFVRKEARRRFEVWETTRRRL